MHLGREPVKVLVDDLAAHGIDADALDDVVAARLLRQREPLNVARKYGPNLSTERVNKKH